MIRHSQRHAIQLGRVGRHGNRPHGVGYLSLLHGARVEAADQQIDRRHLHQALQRVIPFLRSLECQLTRVIVVQPMLLQPVQGQPQCLLQVAVDRVTDRPRGDHGRLGRRHVTQRQHRLHPHSRVFVFNCRRQRVKRMADSGRPVTQNPQGGGAGPRIR